MRVKLGGNEFTIKQVPQLKDHGSCEVTVTRTGKVRRVIRLASWNTPRAMLGTAVHEAIHASRPDLSETEVRALEADIARLLWRMGYRLPTQS
jgi:hypothetical protein